MERLTSLCVYVVICEIKMHIIQGRLVRLTEFINSQILGDVGKKLMKTDEQELTEMVCVANVEDEYLWQYSTFFPYYKQYLFFMPGQDPESFKTWLCNVMIVIDSM